MTPAEYESMKKRLDQNAKRIAEKEARVAVERETLLRLCGTDDIQKAADKLSLKREKHEANLKKDNELLEKIDARIFNAT